MNPEIKRVRQRHIIAGQSRITAVVVYPGEEESTVEFVGSGYGSPGPILMRSEAAPDGVWVSSPARFGDRFGIPWVRAFFGESA